MATHTKGAYMTTKNVLTFSEMYRLTNWLVESQTELTNLTQDQISDKASFSMGFDVTTPNIVRAAAAANIPIGAKNVRTAMMKKKVKSDQAIMAQAICNLYLKLGELIPSDLSNLVE